MKLYVSITLIVSLFYLSCLDNRNTNDATSIIKKQNIIKHLKVIRFQYTFGVQDSLGFIVKEINYDFNGNEIESSFFINGNILEKYISRYDSLNRLSEKLRFGMDGKLKTKTLYSYNSNGNIISEELFLGEELDRIESFYYKKGKKTYQYEYLNNGLVSKEIQVEIDGKKRIIENEYDSLSRLINRYEIVSNKKKLVENNIYDNKNTLKYKTFYSGYNTIKTEFAGFVFRETWYDEKGTFVKHKTIWKNFDHKIISEDNSDSNDEPIFVDKYFYEYY